LLRTIAGLAYFNAAAEGASQIDAAHAEAAARMRNELAPAPSATLHAPSPCSESPCSEPADIDLRPEFPPADPDDAVVEASPDAPDSPAEDEPQSLPYTEVFAPMEAARDSWPLPSAKSVIALGIVLLIAGAGGLALISGRSSPEIKPQAVTPSPAIAAARPAEAPASQPSSETAPATIAAPAQSPDEVTVRPPSSLAAPLKRQPLALQTKQPRNRRGAHKEHAGVRLCVTQQRNSSG
jgi:hypothetical protein